MLTSLKNIRKTATEIAGRERLSVFGVFADILWCWLRYGSTRGDYEIYDFVRLRSRERANIVSYKKYLQIEKWFNDPVTQKNVDNKRGFLENYAEFVGRKWLALSEAADDELRAFLEAFPRVIQKPEDSCQGKGICRWESAGVLANKTLFFEILKRGGLLKNASFNIRKWQKSIPDVLTQFV